MLNIRRPAGVVRSKLSRKLTNAMPRASDSPRAETRCFKERPNRSSFQTRTASNRSCLAPAISLFNCGRESFEPDTPTSANSLVIVHRRRSQYSRNSRSFYLNHRIKEERKRIEAAPAEDRASLVAKTLE